MPKHIKIRAELSADRKVVSCVVLEMSHKGTEFSSKAMKGASEHHTGCFLHGPILLCAVAGSGQPYCEPRKKLSCPLLTHYVVMPRGCTNNPFSIPVEVWPSVKAAFVAYNKWGESQQ